MWALPVSRYKGNSANINKMMDKELNYFQTEIFFKLKRI